MNELLLESLINVGLEAWKSIETIRANDPQAYANVAEHRATSLAKAKAALAELEG